MATERLVFELDLSVFSPFLFRGLSGARFGLDAAQLRDAAGRPLIPADQVRGVFRDAFLDLAEAKAAKVDAALVGRLFGAGSGDADGEGPVEPARSTLLFDDLVARGMIADPRQRGGTETPLPPASEHTRVAIDDDLGAAAEGQLQVVELAAPFGAAVRFSGRIVAHVPAADVSRVIVAFEKALGLVSAIGALKSPGFGEVDKDRTKIRKVSSATVAAPKPGDGWKGRRRLRLRFDRPILVDAVRVADNVMLGSTVVPGAVVKGALAERLRLSGADPAAGDLGAALSALSVSHAFQESATPGVPGGLPLPLSIVAAEAADGTVLVGDALSVPPGRGALLGGRAGVFASDWKEAQRAAVAQALKRPAVADLPLVTRTHTAIERDRGAAKDTALFTTIARAAGPEAGDPAWLLDVDLDDASKAELGAAAEALVGLLLREGLHGIGKTGARASFEAVAAGVPAPAPVAGKGDSFAVVLTTPALMLDPAVLLGDAGWTRSAASAYADYWSAVLPGAELVNHYASQSLAGGYLSRRRRLYGADRYFPFLVTDPGSVFLVRTTDVARLAALCRYGLPVPRFTGTATATDWRTCPFVPENGFGRITADHLSDPELHRRLTEAVRHA